MYRSEERVRVQIPFVYLSLNVYLRRSNLTLVSTLVLLNNTTIFDYTENLFR